MLNKISGVTVILVFAAGMAFAAPAELPKTGQTICYNEAGTVVACTNTGQDGELQKGVAWPSPRFTTNADTSVADNLTGLVWAPDGNLMSSRDSGWDADGTANDGAVTWQHALDYAAKLNAENYLGHNDWRLPDINELESLVNQGQSTAPWLATQGFINTLPYVFWSSTSYVSNAIRAWTVDMYGGGGSVRNLDKVSNYYVWPVRGGE